MLTVTVSQLNRYVKAILEEDAKLSDIYVKGEISNFNRHCQSGHCYFTLKDKGAMVRCVMFSRHAQDLGFLPQNGMGVVASASVGVYERDGQYQLYVTDLIPEGAGALALAYEQRKRKLEGEGLFDPVHKKALPPYPRRIGIATSETGAALQDMLSILGRRYPVAAVVFCPALVQGKEAPASLVKALETLEEQGNCDVIIIGRGGGSAEDLWSFNDEALARAVFRCTVPVISAVGHETDFTICDFVADMRAPTPSAAAELAVPSREDLARLLENRGERLRRSMDAGIAQRKRRLAALQNHPSLRSPMGYVAKNKEMLDFYRKALYNRKRIIMHNKAQQLGSRAALLDSLSPLRVLERGYSLVSREGAVVRSVEALNPGDRVTMQFARGTAQGIIENIDREDSPDAQTEIL